MHHGADEVAPFANTSGGVVILGLDEADGLAATGVLVVAEVPEVEASRKPCYYRGAGVTQGSCVRVNDGDRHLSAPAMLRDSGTMDNESYRRVTGVDSQIAHSELRDLVGRGIATQVGSNPMDPGTSSRRRRPVEERVLCGRRPSGLIGVSNCRPSWRPGRWPVASCSAAPG